MGKGYQSPSADLATQTGPPAHLETSERLTGDPATFPLTWEPALAQKLAPKHHQTTNLLGRVNY